MLGGLVAIQSASAGTGTAIGDFGPGYVKGALVQIAVGSPRGTYIDANGIPHCLPSGPNAAAGKSGDYPAMWYSGANASCSFGGGTGGGVGPAGPAGPKGDKGDPGDSIAKVVTKSVTLTASSPATQTVVITGLPKFAPPPALVELAVNNAGEAPSGTTVTVSAAASASGSTERSFTVGSAGFAAGQSFTLTIKVLAVSA